MALLLSTIALMACTADTKNDRGPALPASGSVEPGRENWFRSADGKVEVTVPGDSVTGTGRLAITATADVEGRAGWLIELEGTELTGPATLRFTLPDVADGEPLPLVRRARGPGEHAAPVEQGTMDGDQLVLSTTHFSAWFLDTWGSVLDEAKAGLADRIDHALSMRGEGKAPRCADEAAVRVDGYRVSSDNGRRVYWCLGKEGGGPTLKIVNARGYGVAAEATPGVTIVGRDRDDFNATWAELFTPPPGGRGNTVELLAPGGSATYRVESAPGTSVGVKVEPNAGAYLLAALQFATETFTMVMTRTGVGKADDLLAQLNRVLEAGDCLTKFSGLATSNLSSSADVLAFFENALGLALGCVGEAAQEMDLGLLGSTIIEPVVWLFSGLSTAVTGLVGAVESLDVDGYQILIAPPESSDPVVRTIHVNDKAAFVTPSGNILCLMDGEEVRCHVDDKDWQVPAGECDPSWLAYGPDLGVDDFVCASDSIGGMASLRYGMAAVYVGWHQRGRDPVVPVLGQGLSAGLGYGTRIDNGRIACLSQKSGVTCTRHSDKASMSVSRTSYFFD